MRQLVHFRNLPAVLIFHLLFTQVALVEVPPFPTLSDGPADQLDRPEPVDVGPLKVKRRPHPAIGPTQPGSVEARLY